jgi:hypothetical protein
VCAPCIGNRVIAPIGEVRNTTSFGCLRPGYSPKYA